VFKKAVQYRIVELRQENDELRQKIADLDDSANSLLKELDQARALNEVYRSRLQTIKSILRKAQQL